MDFLPLILDLVARLRLLELARATVWSIGYVAGFLLVIGFLEWRSGTHPRRYLSAHFFNDVAYTIFYRGGFYGTLIAAATVNLIQPRLDFLRVDLLAQLPPVAGFFLYWIIADFLGYWIHRLQHHSRFLWAFHSVHHAPEQMSFLTSFRLHPVEQLVANLIMIGPLLLLGIPTYNWLPLVLLQNAFELVQHAELRWQYGPLYRVVVSPTFHAFHHSTDPAHHDRNFGKILSLWDFVFGTGVRGQRPTTFGLKSPVIPERLTAQFIEPFRLLKPPPAQPPAAAPEPEPTDRGTPLACPSPYEQP
jgi:sterol desaturase/sphingolipid hydroxylase (fatty acid hydroxylase superfamily)